MADEMRPVEVDEVKGEIAGSFHLPSQSLAAQYLTWLSSNTADAIDMSEMTIVRETKPQYPVFATVVVRTQGNREEKLREVLLCLSAQTDSDFELIIIGHNISDGGIKSVSGLVDSQVDSFRSRIRFIAVQGGKRAHPLNVGFEMARGSYVTILDDDDIVFDNWIEAFHEAVKKNNGCIIHNGVFTQKWKTGRMCGGEFSRAVGSPMPEYCNSFDPIRQISMNKCPTMSLAFPLFVFKQCGVRFNETLTTTEDWDFLMRASNICGVVDGGQSVAIYRLWESADNSHVLHSDVEWAANRCSILEGFEKMPLLMPSGTSELIVKYDELIADGFNPSHAKLYYSLDGEFSEVQSMSANSYSYDAETDMVVCRFEGLEDLQELGWLRFDPAPKGRITLSDFSAAVFYPEVGKTIYPFYNIRSNGISSEDRTLAFLCDDDPQIIMHLDALSIISCVEIRFHFSNMIEDNLNTGTRIIVRAKAKARRIKQRIVER